MRIFITLAMTLALAGCSAGDKANEQQQAAPAAPAAPSAPTSTASNIDPDKVEVRFQIAKASLPATLTAEPSAKDLATRREIVGKDLAAVVGALKVPGPGTIGGPKCFKVCENQCFGIGDSQTCVPQCHIECID